MYTPTLGRFMSRDALHKDVDLLSDNNWFGENLDAMSQNPYAYVSNNPSNCVDPSGYDARPQRAPPQPRPRGALGVAPFQGCNDAAITCIKAALTGALRLLADPRTRLHCFGPMLEALGAPSQNCTADQLADCLGTYLESATFSCKRFGLGKYGSNSYCEKVKTYERRNCANATCFACRDKTIEIEIGYNSHPNDIATKLCPGGKPKPAFILSIIHEAAHACVGSHEHGRRGKKDTCCRPDPYEIDRVLDICQAMGPPWPGGGGELE